MKDFSCVAYPITSLQWEGKKYVWLDQRETTFNMLKEHLTSVPVLIVPNHVDDFVVCMDVSLEGLV